MHLSRSEFLRLVAGGATWLAAPRAALAGWRAAPAVATAIPLTAVRLTGGPLKAAQDRDAAYLLSLDPDRLLAFYRVRAGLEPKAPGLTGWDADGRQLTGHIAGHYLSAVSLMWAATGDARFKARADTIVAGLKEVQDRHGDGFAGALSGVREAFAEVSRGEIRSANFDLNGLWSPWYTLHKTFAGLRDAWRHTGNRTALEVETTFARWAEGVLSPMTRDQVQRMLGTEFGGMNEVLADLYADTGDRRWLALSYRFEHAAVLDPLVRGEDPLNGLHGNTQVPKLLGSAARYDAAGDSRDHAAATTFWTRVVEHHTFASGGHGKDEYFREPDRLASIVDGRTAETCNVYNMLKLTRTLFAWQPDVRYAEYHERALFNHILGSMDPSDGATCYMVPVGRGVRREYADMGRSFTCCVGTGMESHALHGLGLYYEAGDRLWVNLYAPSTARWEGQGVTLAMDTTFPEGDSATLRLALASPRRLTLSLRRPSWAGDGFEVRVNGRAFPVSGGPGTYVEVAREWRDGDTVSLTLPKVLHVERLADDPTRAAVLWGPLVLAGDLGPQPDRADGDGDGPATAVVASPAIVTERPVTEWLRPVAGRPGAFRTAGVGTDVTLAPFHQTHRRIYTGYWDLLTPAEHARRLEALEAERARQRRLEAATAGYVAPSDDEADERAHRQQGEATSIVRTDGRPGRRAAAWFSYDVALAGEAPAWLVATYNRDNRRARSFDVLVDGEKVGEERIPFDSAPRFYDREYALPAALVAGKARLTIRFEATGGNEIAPVYGLRLVRAGW
ncbi:MAG: glycoside hydrolase family 127 protein [Vicinamibacterales bacterium]